MSCHQKEADDMLHSQHYNWEGELFEHHGKTIRLGKNSLLNNFCIGVSSNYPRCTSCHIGYGWKDEGFDRANPENLDCLVCHDTTGTYEKFPPGAGYPVYEEEVKVFGKGEEAKEFKKVNLLEVARKVGEPSNANCGACHFYGGGGHNVKRGDLTKSLIHAAPDIDIHMGNPDPSKRLRCIDCHKSPDKHDIRGSSHGTAPNKGAQLRCSDCHGEEPHKGRMLNMLNRHAQTVSCETCHIPIYSKGHPTKTWWDWTTAGDKKKEARKDANGMALYSWQKGDFLWGMNLRPEYLWFNGKTDYYLMGEAIEKPEEIFSFNTPYGSFNEAQARIHPFKVMRGKQFYDKQTKMILLPNLFGKDGYWTTLDWDRSFRIGMDSVGQPYSGSYAELETQMFWPLEHMVAPAKKALKCRDCHAKGQEKSIWDWNALGYPGDPVKTGFTRKTQGIIQPE